MEPLITWGYLYRKSPQIKHKVIEFSENETFFGRDGKRCDVVFSEGFISGVHALISRNVSYGLNIDSSSHVGIIYDLSTNGTFINGHKIGKYVSSLIFPGDVIQFFGSDLAFIFEKNPKYE